MSIIKPNNNTISAITALPAAITTGKVLQVVQGNHTSNASTSSTSFQDLSTNTNVSITPSSSSNKILVLAHFNELFHNSGTNTTSHYIRVTANGSEIHRAHTSYTEGLGGEELWSYDLNSLHSPNTTSAVEYKMQFRSNNGQSVTVNQNSAPGGSQLILMEIAG